MNSLKDRIQFAYEGGLTERFHTRPGLRRNTTAQHSHGVAMLCYWLADRKPSANLLMSALTHDTAEQVVGDVPAPTKWALGSEQLDCLEQDALNAQGLTFPLSGIEERQLRMADALDGLLYCSTELQLGNRRHTLTGARWVARLQSTYKKAATPQEWDVAAAVIQIWEEALSGQEAQRFDL